MAIYMIRSNKGQVVRFQDRGTVTAESKQSSGRLTNNAIEGGSNINDHFAKDPISGSLQGVLIDGGSSVATLEKMQGEICHYTGSFSVRNIVITDLDFSTSSSNKRGFEFSLSWAKADIVAAQYVPAGATPLMSQQDSGKAAAVPIKTSAKPAREGLQTPNPVVVSTNAYINDYVASFDSKPKPSTAPSTRNIPIYSGV